MSVRPLSTKLYLFANGKRRKTCAFYKVLLFPDARTLRLFAVEQSKLLRGPARESRPSHWKHCVGAARHFGVGNKGEPKQVGCVLLCRDWLGSGVVAHEMAHAALYHVKHGAFPVRLTKRDDERLGWHVGELVRQFYAWYWRLESKGRRGRKRKAA